MKYALAFFCLSFLVACSNNAPRQVVFADKSYTEFTWSEEELAKDIAVKTLYRGEDSSGHIVRLNGKEFPHFHDRHDLSVTVLSGTSVIHFKDREVVLRAGDVATVPKGTYHWAEKQGDKASVVYVVFSPAFDGKDRRRAD